MLRCMLSLLLAVGVAACGAGDSSSANASGDSGTTGPDTSDTGTPTGDVAEDTGPDAAEGPGGDSDAGSADGVDAGPGASTCTDDKTNGTETDLNCGGECPACDDGQACLAHADCKSGSCIGDSCAFFGSIEIHEIQIAPSSAECTEEVEDLVTQTSVSVTGVVASPIFSVSAGLNGAYIGESEGGENSGLLVVWNTSLDVEAVVVGAVVEARGDVQEFYCNTQLSAVQLIVLGDSAPLPKELLLAPVDAQKEGLEGTRVRLEEVAIADTSTAADGYVVVSGGLSVELGHFQLTLDPAAVRFTWVTGHIRYSSGAYQLAATAFETSDDPCTPNPCQNQGACAPDGAGYACECAPGFEGKSCATDTNECEPNPCPSGGTCTDAVNGFSCSGDTCGSSWPMTETAPLTWTGTGDTAASGLTNAHQPTGCAKLGALDAAGPAVDEVWSFTAPEAGVYRVTVTPTGDADLFVYAYTSATCGEDSCIGYLDDAGPGGGEVLELPDSAPGAPFVIVVDSYDETKGGAYELTVERTECPGSECVVTPNPGSESAVEMDIVDGRPVLVFLSSSKAPQKITCSSPTCASGTNSPTNYLGLVEPSSLSQVASPVAGSGTTIAYSSVQPLTSPHSSIFVSSSYNCVDAVCPNYGSWQIKEKDGQGASSPSPAVSPTGKNVVAFVRNSQDGTSNVGLELATCSGVSECTLATIDSGAVGAPSLAFGGDGLPVIAYEKAGGFRVAHCGDVGCTTGISINQISWKPGRPTVAIGKNGLPKIAQRDPSTGMVDVFNCGNAICNLGSVVNGSVAYVIDSSPEFAILGDGTPVMAVYSNGKVQIVNCADSECTGSFSLVTVSDGGTEGLSLAVGADGHPLVAYFGPDLTVQRVALP